MATRTKSGMISEIRTWAMKQSEFKKIVGTRGRLPAIVIEAYNQAHPDAQYVIDSSPTADVADLLEQAEGILRSGVALMKINEVIEEMEDPDRDFFHPDVARRLRAAINEGMSTPIQN